VIASYEKYPEDRVVWLRKRLGVVAVSERLRHPLA
jgi:hypothetical protein